jgi:hypothetical protein
MPPYPNSKTWPENSAYGDAKVDHHTVIHLVSLQVSTLSVLRLSHWSVWLRRLLPPQAVMASKLPRCEREAKGIKGACVFVNELDSGDGQDLLAEWCAVRLPSVSQRSRAGGLGDTRTYFVRDGAVPSRAELEHAAPIVARKSLTESRTAKARLLPIWKPDA